MRRRPHSGFWTRNDFRRARRRAVWCPRNPWSYTPPSWPQMARRIGIEP